MAIDIDTPESPGWFINQLAKELHSRRYSPQYRRDEVKSSKVRPPLELLDAYRRGDPPLREDIHSGWAAPFRQFVRMGRLNFARKLVSPTSNRMGLRGFRTAAADDELGDVAAHALMRRNKLKLVARDVHDDMLTFGDGYTLTTPPDKDRDHSLITSESPLQCITAHDPATGKTLAGLKMFRDDWDASDWAYLYLPGEVWVARKPGHSSLSRRGHLILDAKRWEWEEDLFDDVPGNRVPMVRFRNERGTGEFEEHLDHLDRINDKIFNEWWISKIQAFRQRALERDGKVEEGDYDEDDDPDGPVNASMSPNEIADMFVSSPDALWDLPPGAKLWESTPVSVDPLVNSIQKELQWLAAAADKPLSSLNPDAANQSAEGSTNQKEEHLFQVGDRRDRAEAGWAETLSYAFEFAGDPARADVSQIEVLWGPIELHSLAQKASAAAQAGDSLPREAIQRDIWQYDPTEVQQLKVMDGRDLLFGAPSQPPRQG